MLPLKQKTNYKMNISSVVIRSISGIIYMAIIILSIFAGEYGVYLLASLFTFLGIVEFFSISHSGNDKAHERPTLFLDIAGGLCLCWCGLVFPLILWVALLILRFIEELYIKSDHPLRNVALSVMSQLYIGLPLGLMVCMGGISGSYMPLLALFFLIWINDTGAFVVGCSFGKHKLFERISPKKTWEGFFGGLIFNVIASVLFGLYCPDFFRLNFGLGFWIGLGALVTIAGTFGDLFESMIKRDLSIKDSGHIIPGHGGILDRIDSLLFVMPMALIYISIFDLINFNRLLNLL